MMKMAHLIFDTNIVHTLKFTTMSFIERIVQLSNGKLVANFSSPHPFTFEDGSVLPAVSEEESRRLSVEFLERVDSDGDVELDFRLTRPVLKEMKAWAEAHSNGLVDVVFCPLPMMTAIKDYGYNVKKFPFRSIRMVDRIDKKVSITKQCI